MKVLAISILMCISTLSFAQEFNRWGEKYLDRFDKDIIAVEHKESIRDGHTMYSIYFRTTLREKDVMSIMHEKELLYLEYSHYKVTVIVRETKKRKVKKVLRGLAGIISQSAKDQVYYKFVNR